VSDDNNFTPQPPSMPTGPDHFVIKIAKAIRHECWGPRPGSVEWHNFASYRRHTIAKALGVLAVLQKLPVDMLKVGGEALGEIFETATPIEDFLRIWNAMLAYAKAQHEVESEKRRQGELELRWARQAVEDEQLGKRGRLG
jgi:hypothetical protein